MAAKTTSQPDGSVGAVLIVLAVLISLWQYILALVIVIVLVVMIRYIVVDSRRRGRVQNPVVIKDLTGPEEPVQEAEPDSPEYLPRWTKSRRKDAKRELAQWQELFDIHAV